MLLRQFDELAVQAEVLIDVLYEQLIGQQSRSYCGDMRERVGPAFLCLGFILQGIAILWPT